jgi:hypothetical protein
VSEKPFGLIGVFDTPAAVKESARSLRELGLRALEAYTPYPVEGLDEIIAPRRHFALPLTVAAGALAGACIGYFIQYWDEVLSYPINVGGRPHNSWPAFIVGTFELTLLFAVVAGFFGLWLCCRLPRLYHPLFAADGFERASRDRFLLCVESRDPGYEPGTIRRVFSRHGAAEIVEVRE